MDLYRLSVTFFTFLQLLQGVTAAFSHTDHTNILNALLTGYDPYSKPEEPTDVSIVVELFRITGLDIVDQSFGIAGNLIVISSWLYVSTEIQLELLLDYVLLSTFEENGEWELVSSSMSANTIEYYLETIWPSVDIRMTVKRKYTYYLINMVLPVVTLNVLGVLVFTLPAESGEKVGFSLTILLSLSVVLTILADGIPTTSLNVCILSIYLLVGFILSSFEVVMTVVVLKLFTNEEQEKPMSPRVQKFARVVLRRLSMYNCNDGQKKNHNTYEEEHGNEIKTSLKSISSNKVGISDKPKLSDSSDKDDIEEPEDTEYSWKDMCKMVDTICLYSFAFLTFAHSLVFLLILSVH